MVSIFAAAAAAAATATPAAAAASIGVDVGDTICAHSCGDGEGRQAGVERMTESGCSCSSGGGGGGWARSHPGSRASGTGRWNRVR